MKINIILHTQLQAVRSKRFGVRVYKMLVDERIIWILFELYINFHSKLFDLYFDNFNFIFWSILAEVGNILFSLGR